MTDPLAFDIDTESAIHEQTASTEIPTMQPTGNQPSLDNLETENSPEKEHTYIMKRKVQSPVPKLIDNKQKHLEKTLSSSQHDRMLLKEAKEHTTLQKDLSECMGCSTESFTNAMNGISSTLVQLGKSICMSVEMLSQAMVSQQQQQQQCVQPGGVNQTSSIKTQACTNLLLQCHKL